MVRSRTCMATVCPLRKGFSADATEVSDTAITTTLGALQHIAYYEKNALTAIQSGVFCCFGATFKLTAQGTRLGLQPGQCRVHRVGVAPDAQFDMTTLGFTYTGQAECAQTGPSLLQRFQGGRDPRFGNPIDNE